MDRKEKEKMNWTRIETVLDKAAKKMLKLQAVEKSVCLLKQGRDSSSGKSEFSNEAL